MEPDENLVTPYGNMPILSLLLHCIRQAAKMVPRGGGDDSSDPAYEIHLTFIVGTLQDASFGSFGDAYQLIPHRPSYGCQDRPRTTPGPPTPFPSGPHIPQYKYNGTACSALGPHPIPVY